MRSLLGCFAFCCLLCSAAMAAEYRVASQDELQAALDASATNGEDDRILVLDGSALLPAGYERELGHSLEIIGGFAPDFSTRVRRPPQPEKAVRHTPEKNGAPAPQMSTTGPTPPQDVQAKPAQAVAASTLNAGGVEKVLGAPGYLWRHGCGPTAGGMLLGYYDIQGFDDLFDGAADTQTEAVDQGIASQRGSEPYGHYEDYSLPMDTDGLLADRSELGGAHTSDSVADFMRTSWSVDGMRYGWSYSNYVATGVGKYAVLRNADYTVSMQGYYLGGYTPALTWEVLTGEIDAGRPMLFLVDSSGSGSTDHFVTVVGYRDGDTRQYGCLDTWEPVSTVRWCEFAEMADGQPWGIWGGSAYTFERPEATPAVAPVNLLLQD